MRKDWKQKAAIALAVSLLFSAGIKSVQVKAADYDSLEKAVLQVESESPVMKIEKKEDRLQRVLDNIDEKNEFTKEELAKISEVATIQTRMFREDNMEIMERILEPIENLAIITREDGSTEYINKKVVYSSVKNVGTTSSTTTINKVYFKTELTYFHFNAGNRGHKYVKLIRTDCRINSGSANLSTLQATYSASGTQYNENAKKIKTGGKESGAGRVHKVNGNGLYTYHTTTKYYYDLPAVGNVIKVTMKLKFKTGTIKKYNMKI